MQSSTPNRKPEKYRYGVMIGTIVTIVPILFFFYLIAFTESFCKRPKIENIRVIVSYPIINDKKELIYYPDTIPIYFYKNIFFYELPYDNILIKYEKAVGVSRKYRLFAQKINQPYGFLFNSIESDENGIKLLGDSLLNKWAYKTDVSVIADSMILISKESEGPLLKEKYIFSREMPAEGFDTAYLYYNKELNGIKYSYAHRLDILKGAKLYRIELKFNKKFSPKENFIFPKRELSYEIQKCDEEIPKKLVNFIKRTKKELR